MEFEEQYEDVLQNIEFALVQVYRANSEMSDWDTLAALEALIRTYRAELQDRPAPKIRFHTPAQEAAYEAVKAMCDWRLGREQFVDSKTGQPMEISPPPITVEEIIACLKRVRRSVKMWQKRGGRRGYYEFVRQFIV